MTAGRPARSSPQLHQIFTNPRSIVQPSRILFLPQLELQGLVWKETAEMAGRKAFEVRKVVQIVFFVLVASIAVNHTLAETGGGLPVVSSASLHALCPFGGVVTIYQYAAGGTFVKKIHQSSWVLMWIGFLLALLFGPVFCGWICPFGTFQEWIGKVGKRIFGRKFNAFIPARFDRWLRYLRYVVLAWVLYMTIMTGTLFFEAWDPYFTLFNLWSSEIAVTGYLVLAIVFVASFFVERPFCKYACPYGAVLGLFNLFRVFRIKRNAPTCIDCKACDRACPMNITVSTGTAVRDHQCISCMKCTSEQACPVARTVEMTTSRGRAAEVETAAAS
jgi:polyferredoxin